MINSILIISFLGISIDFVLICSYYNDILFIELMEVDEILKVEGAYADAIRENSCMLATVLVTNLLVLGLLYYIIINLIIKSAE